MTPRSYLSNLASPGSVSSELLSALGHGGDPGGVAMGERVVCEHADRCGGCPIIALPYGEQLAMKRGRVVQSASRYPTLELVYTEPVAAADPIVEYRTRAKLIVSQRRQARALREGRRPPGRRHPALPRALACPRGDRLDRSAHASSPTRPAQGRSRPFDPGAGRRLARRRSPRDPHRVGLARARHARRAAKPRDDRRSRSRRPRAPSRREAPSILGVAVNFHEGDTPQILGTETVVVHGVTSAEDRVGRSAPHGNVRLVRAGPSRAGRARARRPRRSPRPRSPSRRRRAEASRARPLRRVGDDRARARTGRRRRAPRRVLRAGRGSRRAGGALAEPPDPRRGRRRRVVAAPARRTEAHRSTAPSSTRRGAG